MEIMYAKQPFKILQSEIWCISHWAELPSQIMNIGDEDEPALPSSSTA